MKSGMRITSNLSKWLLLTLVLTLAPAALASNIWYVDGVNGNDSNDCQTAQTSCKTIGHAILLCSSGDSIKVAPAIYTENLTIKRSLKIVGSGAATTIIDGNQAGTVFTISSTTVHVSLSSLTIRNGSASQNGGGINNSGTLTINKSIITGNVATELNGRGGGINNSGTLTITNSTITGNVAREEVYGFGGGVSNLGTLTIYTSTISGNRADAGGGIFTTGTLTIYTSTISGNSSGNNAGIGGGIFQDGGGTLTINNSTISSNIGTFYGAGIGAANVTTLTINNSTISGNSGSLYGAGIYKWRGAGNGGTVSINNSTISGNSAIYYGGGGGIEFADGDALTLQNTIVANNSGGNCDTGPYGAIITSNGYNLSSDDSCSLTGPGDMNNTDPKLGKFGKYGGPTRTILLLPGSPAIDAGNPNGCTDDKGKLLKTDQRGWPRPGKYDTGGCDIGAFERQKD